DHVITVTHKNFSPRGIKIRNSELQNAFFGKSIRPFLIEIQPVEKHGKISEIFASRKAELRDQSGGKTCEFESKTTQDLEIGLKDVFNSDCALYSRDISDDLQKIILSLELSQPKGPFPKNADKRSFSENHYYVLTKTNQKIERCYSKVNDAVYCEPCWLFADRHDPYFRSS
ncbi:hypothetical protein PV326_014023, partial [Microctonus aethiopoides]